MHRSCHPSGAGARCCRTIAWSWQERIAEEVLTAVGFLRILNLLGDVKYHRNRFGDRLQALLSGHYRERDAEGNTLGHILDTDGSAHLRDIGLRDEEALTTILCVASAGIRHTVLEN